MFYNFHDNETMKAMASKRTIQFRGVKILLFRSLQSNTKHVVDPSRYLDRPYFHV